MGDDSSIVDQRPELLFENMQFCGENPDQCVTQMTLGYKIYMTVLNFGWMPEYSATKNSIGWLILVVFVAVMSFGFFKLLERMYNRFSSKWWRSLTVETGTVRFCTDET